MVCEALRNAGFDAHHQGTRHGAGIGVGQLILAQRIDVLVSERADAETFVEEMLRERPEHLSDDEIPWQTAETQPSAHVKPAKSAAKIRWELAAGAVFVIPGGGHIYSGRGRVGLAIGLLELSAVVWLVNAEGGPAIIAGWTAIVGLLLSDLVGGQRSLRAMRANAPMTPARSLVEGIIAGAVVAASTAAAFFWLPSGDATTDQRAAPGYIIENPCRAPLAPPGLRPMPGSNTELDTPFGVVPGDERLLKVLEQTYKPRRTD